MRFQLLLAGIQWIWKRWSILKQHKRPERPCLCPSLIFIDAWIIFFPCRFHTAVWKISEHSPSLWNLSKDGSNFQAECRMQNAMSWWWQVGNLMHSLDICFSEILIAELILSLDQDRIFAVCSIEAFLRSNLKCFESVLFLFNHRQAPGPGILRWN